ncbi:MAG TPA: Crp/Fnr family transcriptional regulator [Tissierellia bacterium]|jgi:CRP-like cAMP-binding protein|nr:Crp/Fnr family transcriptional regulator [Tissierellia bacterium]
MVIDFYLDRLRLIPLFQKIREDVLLSAFSSRDYRIGMYEKGELVHLALERMDCFDVLLEGSLLGAVRKGNDIKVKRRWRAGALLGAELLFAERDNIPWEISAGSEAVVLHIHRPLALRLCALSENFLIGFLKLCSESTFAERAPRTLLREQIMDYLQMESHRHKSEVVTLPFTKKEWAQRMGVHYNSLFRELKALREEGVLVYDPHSVTLKGNK